MCSCFHALRLALCAASPPSLRAAAVVPTKAGQRQQLLWLQDVIDPSNRLLQGRRAWGVRPDFCTWRGIKCNADGLVQEM